MELSNEYSLEEQIVAVRHSINGSPFDEALNHASNTIASVRNYVDICDRQQKRIVELEAILGNLKYTLNTANIKYPEPPKSNWWVIAVGILTTLGLWYSIQQAVQWFK